MIRFNSYLFSGILLLAMLVPVSSLSNSSSIEPEQEIDHLLQFIEHSGCTFIRNNDSYDGAQARVHIQKKYNYIKKRKNQVSAEEFIKYAASQSSLSKKLYMVHCATKTMTSESWLVEELEQYRQSSEDHISNQSAQ